MNPSLFSAGKISEKISFYTTSMKQILRNSRFPQMRCAFTNILTDNWQQRPILLRNKTQRGREQNNTFLNFKFKFYCDTIESAIINVRRVRHSRLDIYQKSKCNLI